MSEKNAERQKKQYLAEALRQMRSTPAYKAVLDRIDVRCGKWFNAWVQADEEKAKHLREIAKGYYAFDALVQEMINEGETAGKLMQRQGDNETDTKSSPQ